MSNGACINGAGGIRSGFTISNNILLSNSGFVNFGNSVINYNTFYTNSGLISANVKDSTFTNNIIDARTQLAGYNAFDAQSTGNTGSNNMCLTVNGLPTGNGNVNGTTPSTVFVNASNPFTTYSTNGDADFQLSASSPARTAGVGNTQIGAFGGTAPYVLSGVPPYPVITSFVNSGAGNSNTPLTVTISVRSGN